MRQFGPALRWRYACPLALGWRQSNPDRGNRLPAHPRPFMPTPSKPRRPHNGRQPSKAEIKRLKGFAQAWKHNRPKMESANLNAAKESIYKRQERALKLREVVSGWPVTLTSRQLAERCRYVAAGNRGRDGKTRRWGKRRFKPYDPDSVRRRLLRDGLIRFDGHAIGWVNLTVSTPVAITAQARILEPCPRTLTENIGVGGEPLPPPSVATSSTQEHSAPTARSANHQGITSE